MGCVIIIYGVKTMGMLNRCPKCNSELELVADMQICYRCDYWTQRETARLDFAMLDMQVA